MPNNTINTKDLVKDLKSLLLTSHAHASLEDAVKNIPPKMRGVVPDNLPYSIWQIVEHLRIAQWDMLDFSRNPKYKYMKWPADYWPKEKAPKDAAAWNNSIKQIKKDCKDFIALLEKKDADLLTPFPWGEGQNLLREALVIADHNSYHIGEIIVIRRILGIWK
jgi:hypothetical protein